MYIAEQLRLKDEAVRRALLEKQQLMEEILHVPKGEFETIADIAAEPSIDKEETELILAAVNQGLSAKSKFCGWVIFKLIT